MPQIVNDESIIPALKTIGIDHNDCLDYALVGCVELSTQGNYLGWSDAAMFNLVKVLELTLNDGKCIYPVSRQDLKLALSRSLMIIRLLKTHTGSRSIFLQIK